MGEMNEDTRELELWLLNDEPLYLAFQRALRLSSDGHDLERNLSDDIPWGCLDVRRGRVDWDQLYEEHKEE